MNNEKMLDARAPESGAWILIFLAWVIAAVASLGSLFLSEVMGLTPCVLCWYQRIFMYPLVFVLIAGLFPLDARIARYAMPLAVIGWGFAVYHYLIYSGYIPEELQPCSQGVSCAEVNLELFGFVTIPMLSIVAFSATIVLLALFHYRMKT